MWLTKALENDSDNPLVLLYPNSHGCIISSYHPHCDNRSVIRPSHLVRTKKDGSVLWCDGNFVAGLAVFCVVVSLLEAEAPQIYVRVPEPFVRGRLALRPRLARSWKCGSWDEAAESPNKSGVREKLVLWQLTRSAPPVGAEIKDIFHWSTDEMHCMHIETFTHVFRMVEKCVWKWWDVVLNLAGQYSWPEKLGLIAPVPLFYLHFGTKHYMKCVPCVPRKYVTPAVNVRQ